MLKKLLFLILILTLVAPLVYAKKKKTDNLKGPYMIDAEVLRSHQKLYKTNDIDVITHPIIEQPTLPQMVLDIGLVNLKYQWGQQKTLKDRLK